MAIYAIGNEIPPDMVRWYGADAASAFLQRLCLAVKDTDPGALVTYGGCRGGGRRGGRVRRGLRQNQPGKGGVPHGTLAAIPHCWLPAARAAGPLLRGQWGLLENPKSQKRCLNLTAAASACLELGALSDAIGQQLASGLFRSAVQLTQGACYPLPAANYPSTE